MKTRFVIGGFVATMMSFQVLAQQAEVDDMYFNSKDRQKLKVEQASRASVNDKIDSDYKAFKKKHFDEKSEETEAVNPTDSYSARNINPEYISRSNSEQASEDEQNYFVEGYTSNYANPTDNYSSDNYNNSWDNSCNYNNSWYGSSSYNSMYSPYYGYNNPMMMNPYCGGYGNSGWNLAISYTWGNTGWGNPYYNPYSYYPSYYSPYYGYPTYYYGGSDVGANYGKRPSRHSAVVTTRTSPRTNSTTGGNVNGRSRQSIDEYYIKPSRRTTTDWSSDTYSRPTTESTRTRDSYTPPSRSTYSTPSRSSSSGTSTPSRSSGTSSTSRPRGKN